jgi:hypothetical protein
MYQLLINKNNKTRQKKINYSPNNTPDCYQSGKKMRKIINGITSLSAARLRKYRCAHIPMDISRRLILGIKRVSQKGYPNSYLHLFVANKTPIST